MSPDEGFNAFVKIVPPVEVGVITDGFEGDLLPTRPATPFLLLNVNIVVVVMPSGVFCLLVVVVGFFTIGGAFWWVNSVFLFVWKPFTVLLFVPFRNIPIPLILFVPFMGGVMPFCSVTDFVSLLFFVPSLVDGRRI